jgi:SAM-dependent methyltransferase
MSINYTKSSEAVKRESRKQWSSDPAGSLAVGSEPLGSVGAFRKVEEHRYREQPWMHSTFDFERHRGARVLEIGVGLGTDHLQFGRAGAVMTGVDLTPRCVDLTARRFEQEGLRTNLSVMDAEHLEFGADSFDVVYSFGVLHHVHSTEAAFSEVRRVLRPGGVFLGALYSRHSLFYARIRAERLLRREYRSETLEDRLSRIEHGGSDSKPHVRLFSPGELRLALREAGFSSIGLRRRHAGFGRFTERLPPSVERTLGALGGWYLVHTAR